MKITAEILVAAYAQGMFPMADSRGADDIQWFDADPRGILPLEGFHIPRRLQRRLRSAPYRVTRNTAFESVIRACADIRDTTWINDTIIGIYCDLHQRRLAHSVEVWQGAVLVGGLYGVALGGAFFGESMFSKEKDASKFALVHLVAHLKEKGFVLLDTQMVTPVTAQFGAVEIGRGDYHERLRVALEETVFF